MKYRVRPHEIDAVQVIDIFWMAKRPDWIREADASEVITIYDKFVFVHALEGRMRAEPDDWIVRDSKGNLHICSDRIFESTYEVVG